MTSRKALLRAGTQLVILLAYVVVAVGMTWPLAVKCSTHLLAGSGDTLKHYWNGWWVRQALRLGESPFYTRYFFYPTGTSLVSNNFAWVNIAAFLFLSPVVGDIAAYNIPLLLNMALCGYAMFVLAGEVTGDGRAAFVAGLIYECWPYRFSHLGHPNLMSTQWIPLLVVFLIRLVRRGRWQDGVLAGVMAAVSGYTRWQLLLPAGIVGGTMLVCTLDVEWLRERRNVMSLLVAGGVVVVMLAPPLSLLIWQQATMPADLLREGEETEGQTDLLAYRLPSNHHSLLGSIVRPVYERIYRDRSGSYYVAYTGLVTLHLAILGIISARRRAIAWVIMALVLFFLALGPVLRVGGRHYPGVPMPYRLAARLYVVRLMRNPDRYNMFLALPVAVLAAFGMTRVFGQLDRRGRWPSAALACGIGCLVLVEYVRVPIPLARAAVPSIYAQLAAEEPRSAVVHLPFGPGDSKHYAFTQTFHERPMLEGRVSRLPEGAYAFIDGHPLLRVLRQSARMDPTLGDVSRQLGSLAEQDISYLIAHGKYVGPKRAAEWRRYLLVEPRYEGDGIAVYSTSPKAGRDFTLTDELAPGIGPIRVVTSTGCVNPGGILAVDVGWGTAAAPGADLSVELALENDRGGDGCVGVLPLSPDWPTSEWGADTVFWGYHAWRVGSDCAPGAYSLSLGLVDSATGLGQGERVDLGKVWVSQSACPYPLPARVHRVDALLGDELRLVGYRVEGEEASLVVMLHWRAEQRMERDYKTFVHVFDRATTVPVAQTDRMPLWGTHPTRYWRPGEMVGDAITVSLEGVPEGVYGVAVGVYDPATMERLAVVDGDGELQPDGRLVLPQERVEVAAGAVAGEGP